MEIDLKTHQIKSVEIFSAGVWNDDQYTVEDLYAMVAAFNNLKQGFSPYLKLGHDDDQTLAKSFGLPSIGWVSNLYVSGNKLMADFSDVPDKVFKLINAKAYRKVSCEIYFNLDVDGVQYPKVLAAVALLGAETPGVLNLRDILANYDFAKNNSSRVFESMNNATSFKTYTFKGVQMADELKEELENIRKDFSNLEIEKKTLQADLDAKELELNKFKEIAMKAEIDARNARVEKFVSELETKKLSSPSMRDLLTQVLSDKKEFSLNDKAATKEEILENILVLASENSKLNFKETTRNDFAKGKDKEKEMEKEIEKYQKENKCSYAEAYKAVMRQNKLDESEE